MTHKNLYDKETIIHIIHSLNASKRRNKYVDNVLLVGTIDISMPLNFITQTRKTKKELSV